jgi:endoglucanase
MPVLSTIRLVVKRAVATFVVLAAAITTISDSRAAAAEHLSNSGRVTVSKCSGRPCLKRDGVGPYRPKGLIVEGLSTSSNTWPELSPAYRAMGQALTFDTLVAIKKFGADSVRFNVAQVNLDPQSNYYDPKYAGLVASYAHRARGLGMTVLVEINDEQPPGSGRLGRPSDATSRAWRTLAPLLADDQGIMLGAYNEPTLKGMDPADLAKWQTNYDSVVKTIRDAGARNVIVVDGPYFGQQLTPQALSYLVTDPANNLVYGVHPFPQGKIAFPYAWPDLFQNFCSAPNVLCQLTAWNMYDLTVNGFEVKACPVQRPHQEELPGVALQLLHVAKMLNSGIYGWAFDYPM